MLARHSSNSLYNKKGRAYYKKTEGVLGEAWNNNCRFVDNLPASTLDNWKYAEVCCKDWKMNRDEAFNLKMKSRTIKAFSIKNDEEKTIAVIVFESMKPQGFEKDLVEKLMKDGEDKRIAILLEQLRPIMPDPDQASEGGY